MTAPPAFSMLTRPIGAKHTPPADPFPPLPPPPALPLGLSWMGARVAMSLPPPPASCSVTPSWGPSTASSCGTGGMGRRKSVVAGGWLQGVCKALLFKIHSVFDLRSSTSDRTKSAKVAHMVVPRTRLGAVEVDSKALLSATAAAAPVLLSGTGPAAAAGRRHHAQQAGRICWLDVGRRRRGVCVVEVEAAAGGAPGSALREGADGPVGAAVWQQAGACRGGAPNGRQQQPRQVGPRVPAAQNSAQPSPASRHTCTLKAATTPPQRFMFHTFRALVPSLLTSQKRQSGVGRPGSRQRSTVGGGGGGSAPPPPSASAAGFGKQLFWVMMFCQWMQEQHAAQGAAPPAGHRQSAARGTPEPSGSTRRRSRAKSCCPGLSEM